MRDRLEPLALAKQSGTIAQLRAIGIELHWDEPPGEDKAANEAGQHARAERDRHNIGLSEVHTLATQWLAAKRSKDWEAADRVRRRLRLAGVDLDPAENYLSGGMKEIARGLTAAVVATSAGGP